MTEYPTPDTPDETQPGEATRSTPAAETEEPVLRPPDHGSPWHPTHIPHLVMGLALIGLVTVWAVVVPLGALELRHARWLMPLPWLVAGAAGLTATVLSSRRRP